MVGSPVAVASRRSTPPPPAEDGSGPGRTPDTGTRPRPRVLIVEDHGDTREIYAWCMRAAGWQVDTVTNGLEAIVMASALQPDVVVMDLHLPVVDGIEATRRLKGDDRTAHIPVVACTAFGHEHRDEIESAGFDHLVRKPCTPEELRDLVEKLVNHRTP
jgi:two-component system cell cycle response regulator DivK